MSLACYFDCDGTLLQYDDPYAEVFATACDRVDLGGDAAALLDAYDGPFFDAFGAFDPDPYRVGAAAAFEACGVGAHEPGDDDGSETVAPETFAETLRAVEVEESVVRPGTRETLDRLAADPDTTLGVLTNGLVDQQRRKLAHHGLFERFDAYVPSYEVGAHKPDPAIFDAARGRLPADEYAYVGDSLDHDVAPAREAGFLAVHVDSGLEAEHVAVGSVGALGRVVEQF